MKIDHLLFLMIAFGLGAVPGVLSGGGLIHTVIAQFLCLGIAVPVLILLLVSAVERWRQRDRGWTGSGSGPAMGGAALIFTILGFTVGGTGIFHFREWETRRFVARVVPLLDEHKEKTGSYPGQLEEVTDEEVPRYLSDEGHYLSDGDSFTFYYENPDSIMGGLMLTDSSRTWSVAD